MDQFNVSMYQEYPKGSEKLHRQIQIAYERLKLYEVLHKPEELDVYLNSSPLRHLLGNGDSQQICEARRIDSIGHWTLQIAYSKFDPQFFIKNELKWFQIRFDHMSEPEKFKFLEKNKFIVISPTPRERFKYDVYGSCYKIHFTEVTDLVKLAKYPMSCGYVFVPEHKLVFWLKQKLSTRLYESIDYIKKRLPSCHNDQLKTVLSSLVLIKPWEYQSVSAPLKLENLEDQVKHFPLCMKFQYEKLKENHHLKYHSRIQYGLFLKGLGLSLDDAIEMWKEAFLKIMTEKRFLKEYLYYIKHLYGTVGGKINYKPYNCERIMEETVRETQFHGCPFKHWDHQFLKYRLKEERFSDKDIKIVCDLKTEEKYPEACTKYFQCGHRCGIALDEIISHPNQYYEKSCTDIEDLFMSDSD